MAIEYGLLGMILLILFTVASKCVDCHNDEDCRHRRQRNRYRFRRRDR